MQKWDAWRTAVHRPATAQSGISVTLTTTNTFQRNRSVGPRLTPRRRITSLQFNILNMRIKQHAIGSPKWWKSLISGMVKLGCEELADIPFSYGKPTFLRRKGVDWHDLWYKTGKDNPKRKRRGEPPRFSRRVTKAVNTLRETPKGRVAFLTTINAIGLSAWEALDLVGSEGRRLESFIRRRFPHAVFVLFPEVDLLLAKNVKTDLLPDRSWRRNTPDNHVVYKIHLHGLISVPGMTPPEVERAFKFTKSGKRSRLYSGNNQVRALPLEKEPGSRSSTPDVLGIAGYATKLHYRPPVKERMLEGFAEWVWLNHRITSDAGLIRTGGTNHAVMDYCRDCECHFPIGDLCKCEPVFEQDDFYELRDGGPLGDCPGDDSGVGNDSGIDINSDPRSICSSGENISKEKNFGLVALLRPVVSWLQILAGYIRGP